MNGFSPSSHLLLTIAAPLVGAVIAWLIGSRGVSAVRQSAAVTTLVTLALTAWLIVRYLADPATASGLPYGLAEFPWLTEGIFDVRFSLGLDGLSLWMFGLAALLSVTAVFVCWEAI
jgi:NADH-quinone oxidoreductase subunit M